MLEIWGVITRSIRMTLLCMAVPIGLVDCNNFYASCERVFQPVLRGKPVVCQSARKHCEPIDS